MNYYTNYYLLYERCALCPRKCKVDRNAGEVGFCRETDNLRIAWAGLHFGEEPIITGKGGSGTIFFTGCTMRCAFCQNYQISHEGLGRTVSEKELIEIFFGLKEMGAENLNMVTGTHFLPHIISALGSAKERGLNLPVVWNTSGYERTEIINLLSDYISVFLTDVKTLDTEMARLLFRAPDYPERVIPAVDSMVNTVSTVVEDGVMKSGVIIRHLVLPGMIESTFRFLRLFKERWYGRGILSLMFQYTPPVCLSSRGGPVELKTHILRNEYERVMEYLEDIGIEEGYVHDIDEDDEWFPDFTREKPFPSSLCTPLWHM